MFVTFCLFTFCRIYVAIVASYVCMLASSYYPMKYLHAWIMLVSLHSTSMDIAASIYLPAWKEYVAMQVWNYMLLHQ